jgi:hypothetical protein
MVVLDAVDRRNRQTEAEPVDDVRDEERAAVDLLVEDRAREPGDRRRSRS